MRHILLLTLLASTMVVNGQTIERVAFSSVASSNDNFQPVAGTPYGAHLSNANGSLTVAAEYGDGTIEEGGIITSVENEQTEPWLVYPNPTEDVLNIELPEQATISIYNSSGQLIQTQKANGMPYTMSMAGYATGQYLLKVEVDNSQHTYRIIKK
jgi:hypothetical protein